MREFSRHTRSLTDLGFSPVGLDAEEVDGLMPDELLRSLLHDLLVIQRTNHLGFFKVFFFKTIPLFNYRMEETVKKLTNSILPFIRFSFQNTRAET